jgi:hypothetical protein
MYVETKEILRSLAEPGLDHPPETDVLHLAARERVVNPNQRYGWLHCRDMEIYCERPFDNHCLETTRLSPIGHSARLSYTDLHFSRQE